MQEISFTIKYECRGKFSHIGAFFAGYIELVIRNSHTIWEFYYDVSNIQEGNMEFEEENQYNGGR